MTPLNAYASALQEMSRRFLTIAATEKRWDSETIRAHAHTLDRVAFDLIVEDDATTAAWPL